MSAAESSTHDDELSGLDTVLFRLASLLADVGKGAETCLNTVSLKDVVLILRIYDGRVHIRPVPHGMVEQQSDECRNEDASSSYSASGQVG